MKIIGVGTLIAREGAVYRTNGSHFGGDSNRISVMPIPASSKKSLSTYHRYRSWGYQTWVVLNLLIWVPPAWIIIVGLPTLKWRRAFGAWFVRALLWLLGISVVVSGKWAVGERPCVLVANHGSYLDGVLLTGYIPTILIYVAKQELGGFTPMRWLLQRLGTQFVDRNDPRVGSSVVYQMTHALRAGHSILVFPEGGFEFDPGIGRFKMGAFLAATRAQVPLVPVAINGARKVFGGKDPRPRRGAIELTIGPSLGDKTSLALEGSADDGTYDSRAHARKVCDQAREWIVGHLDEPDRTQVNRPDSPT